MQLYFSPLSCSLASRIAFYEAGASASFAQADTRAQKLADGSDYLAINPLGQVPVLKTDDGLLITENVVVLQRIADSFPQANLAPASGPERDRLESWLSFISSELHQLVFRPLLDTASNEGAKQYALAKAEKRLAYLNEVLKDREYLLGNFSVADAYLVTVLNWTQATPIDLSKWPHVAAYYARVTQRPHVARAIAEEFPLYQEQQKARAKAA